MKQLIAIHEVHRDNKSGKSEVFAPGKPFSADDKLAAELIDLGAARLDESGDTESDDGGDVDLNKLTKPKLLKLAEERQVAVDPAADKATIIAALEAAEKAADELV